MTSTQGTPPPGPQPPAQPTGDGKLAERMTAVESEQQRQGGLIDQIHAMLTGGSQAPPRAGGQPADDQAVRDMVRAGVAEITARQQAEAAAAARNGQVDARLAAVEALAERKPAEPRATGRMRIARILVGKQDPR